MSMSKTEDVHSMSSYVMIEDDQKSKDEMKLLVGSEEEERPRTSMSSSSSSSIGSEKEVLLEEEKVEEKLEVEEEVEEEEEEEEKVEEKIEVEEEKPEEKLEIKKETVEKTVVETVQPVPVRIIGDLPAEIRITVQTVPTTTTQRESRTYREQLQRIKKNLMRPIRWSRTRIEDWSEGNITSIIEIALIFIAFLVALIFGNCWLIPFCVLIPVRRMRRTRWKRLVRLAKERREEDIVARIERYKRISLGR